MIISKRIHFFLQFTKKKILRKHKYFIEKIVMYNMYIYIYLCLKSRLIKYTNI